MKREIKTDKSPTVNGLSQAVAYDNLMFISGQLPKNPKTNEIEVSDIKDQTIQTMENIKNILEEDGLNFDNVLKCDIFLSDIKNTPAMNEVYNKYFQDSPIKPARICIEVSSLPSDSLIEITLVVGK